MAEREPPTPSWAARAYRRLDRWSWRAIVFATVLTAPCFWWVGRASAPAREAGHAFLAAVEAGDFQRAFALCGPDLRAAVGDAAGLGRVAGGLYDPWAWTSFRLSGDQATLEHTSTVMDEDRSVRVELELVGGEWRVRAAAALRAGVWTRLPPAGR